jgi:hypothetical protein
MTMRNVLMVLLAALTLTGCRSEETVSVQRSSGAHSSRIENVEHPAGRGSGMPFLSSGRDESLLMSWIERGADGLAAVRFARRTGEQWSEPVTVVERTDLFVNWADFPSVVQTPEGPMYVHWLQRAGSGTYEYDVMTSISVDDGVTWSPPQVLHDDGVLSEHGFVSIVPDPTQGGSAGVVWLDGRNMTGHGHGQGGGAMTLRFARMHPDGTITDRTQLDERVCECCQTGMAWVGGGYVAVYRDRSEEEIRDIAIVRQVDGMWSEPALVHRDGWKIAACPVNGPQIDARDLEVVVAWMTGAEGRDRVFAAFSADGGASFGDPIRIDEGSPLGRVDTVLLEDGSALVVWLEQDEANAGVMSRRVEAGGTLGPPVRVGASQALRAAGFPRIQRIRDDLYVAWTEPGESSEIRLAVVSLEEVR